MGNKRELEAYYQAPAGYKIRWNKGGALPKQLSGAYTSLPMAKRDIEFYMATKTTSK